VFPRMRISSWRPPTMGVSNHTSISLRAVSGQFPIGALLWHLAVDYRM